MTEIAGLEWASADWWSWPAAAEVLGVGEAGGLTSAAVESRSSAGLEQTSVQEGLGVDEEDELLEG